MAKYRPRRALVFLLFRVVSLFIFVLPLKIGLILGAAGGRLCFCLLGKERARALGNLDIAFGNDKSPEEKRRIALRAFENLGRNFVEIINLPKFNSGNINSYITCSNIDDIRNIIAAGKGLIIISGHFGNWEFLAHYLAMQGLPANVIARRIRMEGLEKYLAGIRKKNNVNVLYRDSSAKEIVDLLKKGEFVGIMPDQDMDSVKGVFVDFFGQKAWTPSGPAVLNFLTDCPVICCFIVRRKFGHEILVEGPLRFARGKDRDKDILENARVYTGVIENYIRRFPSHWVWFHDRWKTKE